MSDARRTILVVDDDASQRELLGGFVESLGHGSRGAAAAEDALESIHRQMPDMVLLDVRLPGMSGIDFAEQLKFDPDWGETPIIALSSHAETEIIERSKEAGFHDYIGKFDREGLVESLREVRIGMEEAS